MMLDNSLSQSNASLATRTSKFNKDKFWELLLHALIRHDLQLRFVKYKYEGIRNIFTYLCPEAKLMSRKTSRIDIMRLHQMS